MKAKLPSLCYYDQFVLSYFRCIFMASGRSRRADRTSLLYQSRGDLKLQQESMCSATSGRRQKSVASAVLMAALDVVPCSWMTLSIKGRRNWQPLLTYSSLDRTLHCSFICHSRVMRVFTPLLPYTAWRNRSHAKQSRGFRSGKCTGQLDLPKTAPPTSTLCYRRRYCIAFAVWAVVLSIKKGQGCCPQCHHCQSATGRKAPSLRPS